MAMTLRGQPPQRLPRRVLFLPKQLQGPCSLSSTSLPGGHQVAVSGSCPPTDGYGLSDSIQLTVVFSPNQASVKHQLWFCPICSVFGVGCAHNPKCCAFVQDIHGWPHQKITCWQTPEKDVLVSYALYTIVLLFLLLLYILQ